MRRVRVGLVVATTTVIAVSGVIAGGCTDLGDLSGATDPPACAPNQQLVDGRCVDTDGGTPPIIIADGGVCPDGTQDNDGDKVCTPTCAASAATLKCVHASCDDSKGKAECVCATGYVREGEQCVWRGGPLDPGFQNQPANAWQATGNASFDYAAAATVDPGVAQLKGVTACTLADSIRQTFQMPTVAEGEPFAIEVNGSNPDGDLTPQLRIGGLWLGSLYFSSAKPPRICLGERAYGKDVELAFAGDFDSGCSDTTIAKIDHVSILSAPDCPPPAQIANGDFEGTGNWTASLNADVANGVGSGGSRGGHLATTVKCQSPSLTGKISAPWKSMDRAAISFTYKGTTGQKMILGGIAGDLGEARGTNTFQSASFCVPEYMKGIASSLRFYLPFRSAGSCGDADVRDFVFDDIKFASDPKCPQVANILNGDFETTGFTQPWVLQATESYGQPPAIVSNPTIAHTGNGAMQLQATSYCGTSYATQTITIPPPAGNAGPALKFWYKLPTQAQGTFYVAGTTLTATATYVQKTQCLDPNYVGRSQPISIQANSPYNASMCGQYFGSEVLYVDDVEVTTDATCPAK